MTVLINPRIAARLAAACSVVVAMAPVAAAASTAPSSAVASSTVASSAPASSGRAPAVRAPAYDLCDGHKWSLFGCRSDRHGGDRMI